MAFNTETRKLKGQKGSTEEPRVKQITCNVMDLHKGIIIGNPNNEGFIGALNGVTQSSQDAVSGDPNDLEVGTAPREHVEVPGSWFWGLNNWNKVPLKGSLKGVCKGSIRGFYIIGALIIRIRCWGI